MWGLIGHFFHDITHFDGKFFTSLSLLLRKPGFLSKEYIIGRRARHLNPVRMYVFTSALFFILFFAFFVNLKEIRIDNPGAYADDAVSKIDSLQNVIQSKLDAAKTKTDSLKVIKELSLLKSVRDSTFGSEKRKGKKSDANFNIILHKDEFQSVAQYDSAQAKLTSSKRDGWFIRNLKRKEIQIDQKIKREGASEVFHTWIETFTHRFPQILFVSLPMISFILYLLYIRRRKQFYYVNHAIFLIHIYIYSFINLLLYFIFEKLKGVADWSIFGWLQFALLMHAIWYVFKAMRNFYGQSWFKTFIKFLVLNLLTFIVIGILFSIFFVFSALNM